METKRIYLFSCDCSQSRDIAYLNDCSYAPGVEYRVIFDVNWSLRFPRNWEGSVLPDQR